MNVLLLETIYSNFHVDLARRLTNGEGQVHSFIFNLGYKIYLKGSRQLMVHELIGDYEPETFDIETVRRTRTLHSEIARKIQRQELSDEDVEYQARYMGLLRSYLKDLKIDIVLMHNDLRWQHALSVIVCRELGVRYMVTERGLFRPDTLTVDFKGVNNNSSLSKDIGFYEAAEINHTDYKPYGLNFIDRISIVGCFIVFLILNRFGDLLGKNVSVINKKYFFKYYVHQLFFRLKNKFRSDRPLFPDGSQEYIFVPLQVTKDTQILVHSEYLSTQEFIDNVTDAYKNLPSELRERFRLVFKVHPHENKKMYRFDSRATVCTSNTARLIKNSSLVVTVNSTAGFESIVKGKKVLICGNAFYKIEELAYFGKKETLETDMRIALTDETPADEQLIEKYVNYIKYNYQVNGNLYNYDKETLDRVTARIKGQPE